MNHVETFRNVLVSECRKMPSGSAVLLSGGFDSASVLTAMLRGGNVPRAIYTIHFGEYDSGDSERASKLARALCPDVEFHRISVSREPQSVLEAIRSLIVEARSVRKTALDNALLMQAALARLKRDGVTHAVNAMSADDLWGTGRGAGVELTTGGNRAYSYGRLYDWALACLEMPPHSIALIRYIAMQKGVAWTDPYSTIEVARVLLRLEYREMHKPLKRIVLEAFPELIPFHPVKELLQVGSGVREFMELVAKEKGFKTSIALYNDMARESSIPIKGDKLTGEKFTSLIKPRYYQDILDLSEELFKEGVTAKPATGLLKPDGKWLWEQAYEKRISL